MNIHEYQAKDILSAFGVAVPPGIVIDDVSQIPSSLKGTSWAVKAQIHSGGRGKAGGVKLCNSKKEVITVSKQLLNKHLITAQTDNKGLLVNKVLIEVAQEVFKELYLSLLLDRSSKQVVIVASIKGGVDIEAVATSSANLIIKSHINPCVGLCLHQIRTFGFKLGLTDALFRDFSHLLQNLYQLFTQKDLVLLEINPLIINRDNRLLALDAKLVCEDNALYRHTDLQALLDTSQSDNNEQIAQENQLSYIALDGSIGCMVNGAGLAMATMDLIEYYGARPANFLDIGGSATKERVAVALQIILSASNVKAILINIFGGIVRCDVIAKGILQSLEQMTIKVPIVVRLAGTNAREGLALLASNKVDIISELDLLTATKKAVELVK